jgi:hypothetical protein
MIKRVSNSFSVTTKKYTRKILPKCEYSNQPELVKGLIQTQMIKHAPFFIKDNSIVGFFSSCGHFKRIN